MTDRELLEAAAKAAGTDLVRWSDAYKIWQRTDVADHGVPWRPLADDGDALRLAVRLRIDLLFFPVYVKALPPDGEGTRENFKGDPHAATRRAIVRAAAEIGKAMQAG